MRSSDRAPIGQAPLAALVSYAALVVTLGCEAQQPAGASVSQVPHARLPQTEYVLRAPEGPVPTLAVSHVQSTVRNPYDGNEGAVEEGRFLYVRMNCAYCHGFAGKGGMGPDLTDVSWRYGASDVDIFSSIYRGRAKGMPAWGSVLPDNQIWELVAYVRSLGGATATRYAPAAGAGETRKSAVNTSNR